MKFETRKTENYNSVFVSFKVPFVNKTFRHHTIFYNTPNAWVHGYSSRTEKARYVLFHDFDNLDLQSIGQECRYLQKRFKLSSYHIFKLDRDNSFHAVCLDTFSLAEAYEIQKETSCDLAFIHSIKNLQTKEWVLRIGGKGNRAPPKYYLSIPSVHDLHVKSSAHADFLIKYGVPKEFIRGKKWDGCKNLLLVDYDTANRIEKEELN
jgi:hypothetical protein